MKVCYQHPKLPIESYRLPILNFSTMEIFNKMNPAIITGDRRWPLVNHFTTTSHELGIHAVGLASAIYDLMLEYER